MKWNRCVKKCKTGFDIKLAGHICDFMQTTKYATVLPAQVLFLHSKFIRPNFKTCCRQPKERSRNVQWNQTCKLLYSIYLEWNCSATATSELSCHSCKILLIDLPNNFSRWQTRPSSHKYKLNYFTRWMLRRWNALKILCFVYTLTYFLAILKPTRRGKQSLTVESSHSDEARNGAHSFTLPTGTINKAIPTFVNARSVLCLWKRN